ncbi:hypothetical protein [Aggregatibacter kilianii]|jgi:hypothetical protein|nr:MAG TPA: hypothetical protein [Caudoviricetes sp.]
MKFIEKNIEEPRTGAVASHHVITSFSLDYGANTTTVTVAAYVSKAKKDEGKEALSVSTFTLQAVPDWSEMPYEWALKKLIEPQPEGFVPETYYGYVNPYTYAGGKIKDQ